MRIAMISTYPPIECGIGAYTDYLVEALKPLNNEVHIISQTGAEGHNVYAVFNADDSDLSERVSNIAVKITPDVVHIQHEFGLFGKQFGVNVVPLVYKLRLAGIPVVATLHTVYEKIRPGADIILKALVDVCDAVIVHEEFQKKTLVKAFGQAEKINVIPHGVRKVKAFPDAKKRLDLDENRKVVLLCGYFRPSKGFHKIVDIFPQILKRVPKAELVVAGKMRQVEYADYRNKFFQKINLSTAREHITVFRGQFPQKTFDYILSAADVVPFPYLAGAQSGVMAHALAFKKPLVVSPLRAFKELVRKTGVGMVARSKKAFAEAICKILKDKELASKLSQNAERYVREMAGWDIVARRTVSTYHKIVKVPYGRARYVYVP
ncbi:MAG: hypothetical protein AMS15_03270 [Planctomycetes bacterium DG_23]|nr:MAG: hypothetical protein AMS15_03270 [Planctomycetes bacterium DG_23]